MVAPLDMRRQAGSADIGPYVHRPLLSFIRAISKASQASLADLVVAFTYIGRVHKKHPTLVAPYGSGHRVFLISLILAQKFLEDTCYTNAAWATLSGIFSVKEVNKMELEFLSLIEFELCFSEAEFEAQMEAFRQLQRQTRPKGRGQTVAARIAAFPAPAVQLVSEFRLDAVEASEGSVSPLAVSAASLPASPSPVPDFERGEDKACLSFSPVPVMVKEAAARRGRKRRRERVARGKAPALDGNASDDDGIVPCIDVEDDERPRKRARVSC